MQQLKMIRILITSYLLIGHFQIAKLQGQNWEAAKTKEGITVYTKPVSTSTFDAFKAVMEVSASVNDVRHVLMNSDKYSHIFPDTEELRIIERDGRTSLVQYSRTDAPWPVEDRDGVYEMIFMDREDGGFITKSRALPDRLPEKEGVVRIKQSNSYWRVIPTPNGTLRIEYEVAAEPGGNIPDWLANAAITEIPFNTMKNLRSVVEGETK